METRSPKPDMGAIKDRQQKTWTSGNYAMVGNLLVIMGERLCEAVDLRAGDKVLDVGGDRQRQHGHLRRPALL
jgi:hypothetical protein